MHGFDSAANTEAAFYDAFSRSVVEDMMAVWADTDDVVCVHPLGDILRGPRAIRASWEQLFATAIPRFFEIETVSASAYAELAIHVVKEHIRLANFPQTFAPVIATNIYRAYHGRWFITMHHASPGEAAADSMQGSDRHTTH